MESKSFITKEDIKALVVGATGAVGNLLVDSLLKSEFYSEVSVLVRRKLEKWDKLTDNEKSKLKIIECSDMTVLKEDKDKIESTLKNNFRFDTLFCCLGTSPDDEQQFRRVDYDFVLYTASLCEKFNIPHFSLLSSKNANPNSWTLYLKVKGEADRDVLKKNITRISIFRPPLIYDRENPRFGEKVLNLIPFYPKIKTGDIIEAMINEDLKYHLSSDQTDIRNAAQIHEFKDIIDYKEQKFHP